MFVLRAVGAEKTRLLVRTRGNYAPRLLGLVMPAVGLYDATYVVGCGGPFALAAAAVTGDRVTRVGVVCGPGPYQQEVPGALESWSEEDVRLLSLLPNEPDRFVQKALLEMEPIVAVRDRHPAGSICG